MSEASIGLPLNPFNIALGVSRAPTAGVQNAYAFSGDVAAADAVAPVIGSAPPPTSGQLAVVQLPVAGGINIKQPGVNGLGQPAGTQQYWTGLDLVQVPPSDPDLADPNAGNTGTS